MIYGTYTKTKSMRPRACLGSHVHEYLRLQAKLSTLLLVRRYCLGNTLPVHRQYMRFALALNRTLDLWKHATIEEVGPMQEQYHQGVA